MSKNNGRSMGAANRLAAILAWMQLIISVAMASVIVWGYLSYQASMGQIIQNIATSINAVSNVVVRTAESIEARQDHLEEVGNLLKSVKESIKAFASTTENQKKLIPQYADSIRSASDVAGKLGKVLEATSPHLLINVPSGVQMNGLKPVVTMSRPFETLSKQLTAIAMDAKTSSDKLRAISDAIKVEGPQMLNAISANTGEALKVIGETEIALDKLKAGGLKKAISELRNASKDMDTLSTQMGLVGHVGTALLVVGLLLSAWCFLNSLSVLILTRSNVANNPEASVT